MQITSKNAETQFTIRNRTVLALALEVRWDEHHDSEGIV